MLRAPPFNFKNRIFLPQFNKDYRPSNKAEKETMVMLTYRGGKEQPEIARES
jgi:hypothetical protein